MKYNIKVDGQTITLTSITDGRIINNLTPYEAYSIIHGDDMPNAVTALIERVESMPSTSVMFGSEIVDLLKKSFNPIMRDAGSKIEKLEDQLSD